MPRSISNAARVRVLGPVRIEGRTLGPLSANAVLAFVLARAHTPAVETLINDIWPEGPPAGARQALQTLISRLRSGADGALIETVPGGYRLSTDAEVDLDLAERLVAKLRDTATDPATIRQQCQAALAWWDEPIGGGASNTDLVHDLAHRADAARAALTHALAEAHLALGAPDDALAALDTIGRTRDDTSAELAMRALAASGRSVEALELFADYRARLADGLGADPAPALIDLNTQLLRSTTPSPSRPLRIGLRMPTTELVGRAAALAEATNLVNQHRLVTILGVGGLGKTRLAYEIATRREGAVIVVELAGVHYDDDVERALTSLITDPDVALQRTAGPQPDSLDQLAATLARTPTLLVLDNCEHVLSAAGHLTATLLQRVPGLRVLTTSRRALGIAGEVCYPLAPLASREVSGDAGPAVRLFVERAQTVRPGIALPIEEVARLTERLDGLPLAIELAAARTRSMSVAEISRRLADRFALLTIGDPTAPERHRTLRAVIDWSWDLLTASQRDLGRRLSAFSGSFDTEGAIALANRTDPLAVIDDVDALASHSLLTVFESTSTQSTRFAMVQTVHEYCAGQAQAEGLDAELHRDLAAWARGVAHAMVAAMVIAGADPLRAAIQDEEDNLLTALRQSIAARDVATALAIFGASGMWWSVQGSISETIGLAADVFDLAQSEGVPPGSEQDACLTGIVIAFTQGFIAGVLADDVARPFLRSLLDSDAEIAAPVRFIAQVVLARDDPEEMDAIARRADTDPDLAIRGLAKMLLAALAENTGQLTAAIALGHQAYQIARAASLAWIQAITAQMVAGLYSQGGEVGPAMAWIEVARTDLAKVGGKVSNEDLVQIEAMGALRNHDIDAARAALARWDPAATTRQPESMLMLRAAQAEVALAAGDSGQAVALYDSALVDLGPQLDQQEPWWMITSAARLAVRVQAGLGGEDVTHAILRELRGQIASSPQAITQFADYPVVGTIAVGFATWYAAQLPRSPAGPLLLALAERLQSRQDIPSMSRSVRAAAMDGAALADARNRIDAMASRDCLRLALAVIADPAAADLT